MKFKKGDIVRVKKNSYNAKFFNGNTENLEIKAICSSGCNIYTHDKSTTWWADNNEIEHMVKLTKKQRAKKIKKIIKEINDNPDFKDCFEDVNEVNSWNDTKLSNWK